MRANKIHVDTSLGMLCIENLTNMGYGLSLPSSNFPLAIPHKMVVKL